MSDTTAVEAAGQSALPPFAMQPDAVLAELGSSADRGLTSAEAAARLATYGPNSIKGEKPPSVVSIALGQLRDPMNLMLVAVAIVSLIIGEVSTALVVALLVVLNLALGTRQEITARASVDALSKLQVPQSRVVRDGQLVLIPAEDVVPGDIVQVEAGDLVPADGRLIRSATCETQEAALTGESAPVAKGTAMLDSAEPPSAIARACSSRTPPSRAAPASWWSRPPACRPRWARSRACSPPSSARGRRCSRSWTSSPRSSASSPGRPSR